MKLKTVLALALWSLPLAGCVDLPSSPGEGATTRMLRASFKSRGQATVDRLNQDEVQASCSLYKGEPPGAASEKIEKSQQATIRYPSSGKLLGDWRQGERIAQSGVGRQFTDDPSRPAGGGCYNCHQLAPRELSFGTVGPSLYRFGKLRGFGEETQKYAYGKIYNSQAFLACSNMPRFGHNGVLTEEQITHLVALLLDPDSPVNR